MTVNIWHTFGLVAGPIKTMHPDMHQDASCLFRRLFILVIANVVRR